MRVLLRFDTGTILDKQILVTLADEIYIHFLRMCLLGFKNKSNAFSAKVLIDGYKIAYIGFDPLHQLSHGKRFLRHTFLGSTAKKVLRRERIPVFIIQLPKDKTEMTFQDI